MSAKILFLFVSLTCLTTYPVDDKGNSRGNKDPKKSTINASDWEDVKSVTRLLVFMGVWVVAANLLYRTLPKV